MKRYLILLIGILIIFTWYTLEGYGSDLPLNIDNNNFKTIFRNIGEKNGGIVLEFNDAKIFIVYKKEKNSNINLPEDLQLIKNLIPHFQIPRNMEFSELIPSIIGKEKIYANSVRINTSNNGFRELYFFNTIFNNKNYTYYIFYEDDYPDKEFYNFLDKKISFNNNAKPPLNKIVHDTITTSDSHLGHDKEGRNIITKVVTRNGMKISSSSARRYIDENYRLFQIKTTIINFTNTPIDQGTIHAQFKLDNKLYKTDSFMYFHLEPNGIVDYTTTIPYERSINKRDLQKALKSLKVILKYKESGEEKELILVD